MVALKQAYSMGREQDAACSMPLPSKLLARLHEVSSVFSSDSHTKAVSLAIRERKTNGNVSSPRGLVINPLCTVFVAVDLCDACTGPPLILKLRCLFTACCTVAISAVVGCRAESDFALCDHARSNTQVLTSLNVPAGPGFSKKMNSLFCLWSNRLRDAFHANTYLMFVRLAQEDAIAGDAYGMECLFRFLRCEPAANICLISLHSEALWF